MVFGNLCILSNVHNTNTDSISLQFWRCDYMAPHQIHLPIFKILHFTFIVGGEEVPCNLTQVVFYTLGSTLASRETITTFYESAQLDSGEPNTQGSSNTLSNSIPCVSNYPFIMGNQLIKKEKDRS